MKARVLRRKVLYLQHAAQFGGSCMSLLYTLQGLDAERFEPVVALANRSRELQAFYADHGFSTLTWPGIGTWVHGTSIERPLHSPLTWKYLADVARRWRPSGQETLRLVRQVRPHLVHLNSMVFSPSAVALARARVPLVWHVREHPPRELAGLRNALIGRLMRSCPDELIFISAADRQAWVRGARGQVVHNFVDFTRFHPGVDGAPVRARLGIPPDAPCVLYVGGLNQLKGAEPMIRALALVRQRLPGVRCLMPGSQVQLPADATWRLRAARAVLPLLGTGTTAQRMEQLMLRLGLQEVCLRLPFEPRIEQLLAACDVLAFPATRPHFARPVVEAAAMARPAVASRLAGMEELLDEGQTGALVAVGDHRALARELLALLTSPARARRLGQAARAWAASRFSAEAGCARIMQIYDEVLQRRGAAAGRSGPGAG